MYIISSITLKNILYLIYILPIANVVISGIANLTNLTISAFYLGDILQANVHLQFNAIYIILEMRFTSLISYIRESPEIIKANSLSYLFLSI